MKLTRRIKQRVFDRFFSYCFSEFVKDQVITLDYRIDAVPRFGYGKPPHTQLQSVFEEARSKIEDWVHLINKRSDQLLRIADIAAPCADEPSFMNCWFLGLDAAAYYTIVSEVKPRILIEIGSGNSTKFAHRAIRDNFLQTRLISIDPAPRTEVATICETINVPLERADLSIFRRLQRGDILFVDNSHRAFTNSDVTVFFLEILPALLPGVIVHLHDIFLPFDYPPEWDMRYYSEQYLLASWLLAGGNKCNVVFSSVFTSTDQALSATLAPFWEHPRFQLAKEHAENVMRPYKGYSFWAEINES